MSTNNWVTLGEAKHHLRYEIDDDSNDINLEAYIAGAEAAVANYITRPIPAEAAPDIKIAVLLLVGYYDQYRNLENEMVRDGNFLPAPVRALLAPYRRPTAV